MTFSILLALKWTRYLKFMAHKFLHENILLDVKNATISVFKFRKEITAIKLPYVTLVVFTNG